MPLSRPLLVVAVLAAVRLAVPEVCQAGSLWLKLREPGTDAVPTSPSGWIEVSGWAGSSGDRALDVLIAIDVSGSTLSPSGFDVDGDGRIGRRLRSADDPQRSFHPRRLCNDPDDTIQHAELEAARALLAALPDDARAGMLLFESAPRLELPLGTPRAEIDESLDRLEGNFVSGHATDIAAAIEQGTAALTRGRDHAHRRQYLVLMSDGLAEGIGEDEPRALTAAAAAADAGVELRAFALGAEEQGHAFLGELAEASGGVVVAVRDLEGLERRILAVDLAGLSRVAARNESTGESARAFRLHPDGSFDGFLRLSPGRNRILVEAEARTGGATRVERWLAFEPQPASTPEEARRELETLTRLRDRTRRLELHADLEAQRIAAQERVLELEATVP